MKAFYFLGLLAAAAYAAPTPVLKRIALAIPENALQARDADTAANPEANADKAGVDSVSNQLYGFWAIAVQ